MSIDFFHTLKGFTDFFQAPNLRHYTPAPQDWYVIVTDIMNSTQAITDGRYKEVNMVGAACISAAVNAVREIDIAYVFGGDGATILVPHSYLAHVSEALCSIKTMAQNAYGLSLRIGAVPVREISLRGKSVLVGKYIMSGGAVLTMLKGGGAQLADTLVKNGEFAIEGNVQENTRATEGLSCRWRPINPTHDTMLSLLILETPTGHAANIYDEVTVFLADTLAGSGSPAHLETMRYSWPTLGHFRDARIVWMAGKSLRNALNYGATTLLFNLLNRFNIVLKGFDVTRYRTDMIANSDFRKFDDMLRMIVDCTHAQAQSIEDYLADLYQKQLVVYGTHYSDTALMTCFVSNLQSDGHVHFIDGNDGGYAMAARQLKAQLAA